MKREGCRAPELISDLPSQKSAWFWRPVLCVSSAIFSWLAMMIVHEFGHMLHAWTSGGRVVHVLLHPLAISYTHVEPNPHPLYVVWGGPIGGTLLPVVVWFIWRWMRWPFGYLARFFAGFCLIANGAYIGSGIIFPVGDAEQMIRNGTPVWILGTFGLLGVVSGLWLWNGLGPHFGFGRGITTVDPAAAVLMSTSSLVLSAAECVWN